MDKEPKISVTDELSKVSNWRAGKKILIGFANSTFQTYGECGNSNWTAAARNGTVPQQLCSIMQWDDFERDLDDMALMGVNSYRFSIEWSHIEPVKGQFDKAILKRYAKVFDACHQRNIEPMVTLYHYNEPLWFSEMGSFEKEENIELFTNFCKLVFSEFNHQVKLWLTFNEPSLHSFASYFCGKFPPHKYSLKKTVLFLKHLLKAHVITYYELKKMQGGNDAQIGIVHNPLRFVPRYWWEPIERIVAFIFTRITNDLVIEFLKTGNYKNPFFLAGENYKDPTAAASYDFIGLNFYGDIVLGFNKKNIFGVTCFPHQEMSDLYFPIDPETFNCALDRIGILEKPIYITEIGIADESDALRGKFLNLYFDIIKIKIEDGFNILGCYIWTFADNYEWNLGYSKKFGLHNLERTERQSAKEFKTFIKRHAKRK